jgi:hypothetical protein
VRLSQKEGGGEKEKEKKKGGEEEENWKGAPKDRGRWRKGVEKEGEAGR